ncbi:hypothetical protein OHS58_30375 [Amycolatopsis sp. NBC_00348]|uniref:sensor histidine kinase n=1 Tax=Amycolatopsis sp. NBC_00348 TaxID=2975956 RepID=UPI002E274C42
MTGSATCVRPGPLTAAAVVGAAATAWGQYASGDLRAYDVLAGLLGCALVPLVFRRPVRSTLALAVLAVLSPLATPPAVLGVLQVARSRPWSHAVAVAVAGVAAHALRGLWRPTDGPPGLVEESRAVGTAVQVTGEVGGVPGMARRTAYRVVQEALTNARKHAPGQPVRIALGGEAGARLEIDVTNPLGPAGDPQRVAGHGLVGLTERVRLAGGQLDHQRTGGEFRLRAWLPWPR